MGWPGPLELTIIAVVLVLLFGVKKLPQLGGAFGESIRNFKKGIKDAKDENKAIDSHDSDNNENPSK